MSALCEALVVVCLIISCHSWRSSYSRYIGDALGAATQAIAWSGKGVYKNCCDDGETMPQYFLQTFGAGNFTADWDFSRDTEPS